MEIKLYNAANLGDSVFQMHYMLKNVEHDNTIFFKYYCHDAYHTELNNILNGNKNIQILSLNKKTEDSFNCWIQAENKWGDYGKGKNKIYQNEFYISFFNYLNQKYNITYNFDNIIFDFEKKNNILSDNKYDFLVINSPGHSGQYDYNSMDFMIFCTNLKKKGFKIVTTEKIPTIDSTIENNLSLFDIANISINCEKIISINTSPIIMCFNKYNIDKEIYVLNKHNIYYLYNNCYTYNNINDIKTKF